MELGERNIQEAGRLEQGCKGKVIIKWVTFRNYIYNCVNKDRKKLCYKVDLSIYIWILSKGNKLNIF